VGLLKTLAKPAYEEVVKEMRGLIKSGSKPLYRHSHDPGRLFDWRKFDTFATEVPKVNTGVEPIGLYFAENIPEIRPLLNPGMTRDTIGDIRSQYLLRKGLGSKEYYDTNKGIITGVIPPDVKNMKFDAEEWEEYLSDFLMGYPEYRKFAARGVFDSMSLPNSIANDKKIAVPMAKRLTQRLLDEGADAVTFPDTVADQRNMYQTVLMTHGNMLAKWRKGAETGAGVLGVAGLAAPKFFGWDSGKEME
jgi:hypothetical protein